VIDRKHYEVVGKNQWNMDQRTKAKNQEMYQNADFRWAPLPKPDCAAVLFEVKRLHSIRHPGDFDGTGIWKPTENPGVKGRVWHMAGLVSTEGPKKI
jgi:hypothetical protein